MPVDPRRKIVALTVAAEGGLSVLALLLGWLLGQRPWEYFWWDPQALGLGLVSSLLPLVLFYVLYRWPVGPLKHLKHTTLQLIHELFGRCTLLELALIALLAGFGEEWLFRGVLQHLAETWLHPWAALLAVSVLFGLLHCITPTYSVLATLMGLYLGWLALVCGNLLPAMVNHAFYDFVALVFLIHYDSPLPAHPAEQAAADIPPAATGAEEGTSPA